MQVLVTSKVLLSKVNVIEAHYRKIDWPGCTLALVREGGYGLATTLWLVGQGAGTKDSGTPFAKG